MTNQPPEPKPGQWTLVTYLSRVERPGVVMLAKGIMSDTAVLADTGVTLQVFDHEPGPSELRTDAAVVRRAIAAEMDLATARTELAAAEQARDKAERKAAGDLERVRERSKYPRFLADVARARVRLLTALLEYSHTWLTTFAASPPVPLHELYTHAVRRPCPSYDVEPFRDSGDPQEVPDPGDVGDPCVRVVGHEGLHSTVEGRRFDAEPLFTYLPLPGDPQ